MSTKALRYYVPLGVFVLIAVFLAVGLKLDPRRVPSPLIDGPVPEFTLPRLDQPQQSFSPVELRGKVWLLNVWASWCVACRQEHDVIKALAEQHRAVVVGLNYKDNAEDAAGWLQRLGDPYRLSVMDTEGRVGIDWGVYGVPETFVVDRQGIVRYKHIGPITLEDVNGTILPLIRELERSS